MHNHAHIKRSQEIKTIATELGFSTCGIARAEKLDDEARKLEEWLRRDYHGQMSYMANHFDLRIDPTKLVPGAKTVICLSYNYYPTSDECEDGPKVARYAYGRDYHKVIKRKLKTFWSRLQGTYGEIDGRYFVDSGPVMERVWAERAGLGWRGKNTLLIHPKQGSYYFLAVIISDLDASPDDPIRDHCGTCRRCIDACPTGAFSDDGYILDASKCISYLTIELKSEIPDEFRGKMEDWVFGCDICQEVCPWNRFAEPHQEQDFEPRRHVTGMSREDWRSMDELSFEQTLAGTPLMRAGFQKIRDNLNFLD